VSEPREWTLATLREALTFDRGFLEPKVHVMDGPLIAGEWKQMPGYGNPFQSTPPVKVIEKSAYDSLKAENEALKEQLLERRVDKNAECIGVMKAHVDGNCPYCDPAGYRIRVLSQKNARLMQLLKEAMDPNTFEDEWLERVREETEG
jgi:hypothetical protein